MDKLARFPSAIVQEADHAWSIYVSANASDVPTVIHGLGVDPHRISLLDRPGDEAPFERAEDIVPVPTRTARSATER